jgi:hypothetical protein
MEIKPQHLVGLGQVTRSRRLTTFSCKVQWAGQASLVRGILPRKVTLESQIQAVLSLFCQIKHGVLLETQQQVTD